MLTRLIPTELRSSPKSIFLLGPRQTGKSTLIRSLKRELEINLARETEYLTFAANADELESRLASRTVSSVFIDEIQRLPSLLNTVQAVLDDAKGLTPQPITAWVRFGDTSSKERA